MANIWWNKDYQAMKFGQSLEYNTRTIFLEKWYRKCGGETILRPFSKKSKLSVSPDQLPEILKFHFIVCPSLGLAKNRALAFTSYKVFKKNKKRFRTGVPGSFSASFLKKNISIVIFYYLNKFHCLVAFTSWGIGQYVNCNSLLTRLRRHRF